ncbi:6-pyruvoyl tetrahydropterin synthase family protein [Halonotius sp. F2-221B]|uniref:6-pyruvoyl trahydropterin synthase family protein n=1 Tax=Halonotius sp. F2-221B TaxID=2731620 RepID=UPI00398B9ACE
MPQRLSSNQAAESKTLADAGERELRVGEDRPIRISTGHRILHHEGKCSRPHGHNYEITVSVTGELTSEGWIVDKGDITSVISKWDHRFLVERGDPLIEAFQQSGDEDSLIIIDHPPTAEVMSVLLEEELSDSLPETVSEVAVSVRETGELCAAP